MLGVPAQGMWKSLPSFWAEMSKACVGPDAARRYALSPASAGESRWYHEGMPFRPYEDGRASFIDRRNTRGRESGKREEYSKGL